MKVTREWADDLVHVIIIKKLTFACGIFTFLLRGGQSLKVNRMNYSKLFDLKIRWKISSFLFFH